MGAPIHQICPFPWGIWTSHVTRDAFGPCESTTQTALRSVQIAYTPNLVSIGLFCRLLLAKNPNFCRFFGLQHLVLLPIGRSLRKLNTGAQLQTFPYPTASKSFLYSNAFMAKSSAQSLTFKSVTNKKTNKKTQRFWAPQLWVKSEPHQSRHGDRGPRARSCTSKLFRVRRIVSPLGGAQNLGEPDPLNLKSP